MLELESLENCGVSEGIYENVPNESESGCLRHRAAIFSIFPLKIVYSRKYSTMACIFCSSPKPWVGFSKSLGGIFFKTLVGPKPFVRFSNPGSFICLPLSLCIYWLHDKPRDSYYNYLVIVLLQYIVTYCPFHKTLSSSSSFLNWILVRFYEMDCIKISWYCLISLPPLIPFSGTKRNPPSPLLLVVKLIISTNLAVSYWIFTSSRV